MLKEYVALKQRKKIPFRTLQGFCFYIIAFNLLWAYFEQSFFSIFFSVACLGITGMMVINLAVNSQVNTKASNLLCYVGLCVWSFLMIGVFGSIYSTHSVVKFLFFSMDGGAIFYIRLFVSVLPCMVFVDLAEVTIDKKAKMAMFLVLAVSVFFTAKAVAVNPDALRARGTMEYLGLEEILIGTPNYSITYGFALLTPVFVHKWKITSGKARLFYGVCLALLLYIIVVAQYATAFLLTIMGILVYLFLVSDTRTRVYLVLFSLLVGLLLWATNGGSDIFYALAKKVEGTWATKLQDIALTLEGQKDSGQVSGRTEYYSQSLNAFFQSPILGKYMKNTGAIGGHATAIDVLGLSGIVGFFFMMMSIYGNFARMKNHPSYQEMRPVVITCMVEFLALVFLKNIMSSMAVFFVFYALIPLLLKAKEDEKHAKPQTTVVSLRNTDDGETLSEEK